jgi:curli production assembly/transport component CsgF
MKKLPLILCLLFSFAAYSQQFVYKPVNPMFGGETFNYQMLLSSANAQNPFDNRDNSLLNLNGSSSLDNFTESLNRQILSQLSQKIFQEQFGSGDLKPGTYNFGSLYIEITNASGGLYVNILNTSTGEQSEIFIPQ